MSRADRILIEQLQKQISTLEGNRRQSDQSLQLGLGLMESAFSDRLFPRAAVHELISLSSEAAASTSGFISVLLSRLVRQNGSCLWISATPRRSIFPPALQYFGVEPEQIIFVDTATPKDTLWALEEALKCSALTVVVGELSELGFNDSRRLQLAVERSQVTGLIHRFRPKVQNAVACVSRWKITPVAGHAPQTMPGVGFPRWNVELQKVRNGRPGSWQVQWSPKGLEYIQPEKNFIPDTFTRQTG